MTASEIRIATIGCSDLEESLRFWRDAVGFEEAWRASVRGAEIERAWRLPAGTRAEVVLLRYEGAETGQVRLVELTPRTDVRTRTRGDEPWAVGLGALDCGVRDPERAFELLREAGWETPNEHPHFYEVGGLEQSEFVFYAPDDVRFLCVGAKDYPADLARPGLRGTFSALTTISQFVDDLERDAIFYGEVLGLEQRFDAWVDETSRPVVNEMVGIPLEAELRLALYGAHGEPDGKPLLLQTRGIPVRSIVERMRFPNLGVVALTHATADLAGLRGRIAAYGCQLVTEVVEVGFGNEASTLSFLARTPSGLLLELVQQ